MNDYCMVLNMSNRNTTDGVCECFKMDVLGGPRTLVAISSGTNTIRYNPHRPRYYIPPPLQKRGILEVNQQQIEVQLLKSRIGLGRLEPLLVSLSFFTKTNF